MCRNLRNSRPARLFRSLCSSRKVKSSESILGLELTWGEHEDRSCRSYRSCRIELRLEWKFSSLPAGATSGFLTAAGGPYSATPELLQLLSLRTFLFHRLAA